MTQPFPPRTLLEKMFEDQPTCLILDEFQTWYGGLPDKDPKTGLLLKKYAFNFVQILAEIAKDRPEILILVISVLNNQNDAFQQVHRQGPVIVDFRGPSAKQDRQKLLLHRLFENRRNISEADIISIMSAYASERFRLLHTHKAKELDERQTNLKARQKDRETRLATEMARKVTDKSLDELEPQFKEYENSLNECRDIIAGLKHKLSENTAAKERIKEKQTAIEAQKKECRRWENLHELIGSADGKKFRNFAQGLTFEMMIGRANRGNFGDVHWNIGLQRNQVMIRR